ncbi:hypothetical protein MHYP_G00014010 [Metynnis hypsauchen]
MPLVVSIGVSHRVPDQSDQLYGKCGWIHLDLERCRLHSPGIRGLLAQAKATFFPSLPHTPLSSPPT